MENSGKHIRQKKTLYLFFITLLFLPMIQQSVGLFEVKPLDGYFENIERPRLTFDNWFEGNFQMKQQTYLDENLGFRSLFVRIYNQLYYSLFHQSGSNGVVVGKGNYLFEKGYINAHFGRDFIGEEGINEKVRKLKVISDTLKRKEISLIIVMAPGKGSYLPEFIPEEYLSNCSTQTNYEMYIRFFRDAGISFLDFHSWFREMKLNTPHPLFPKTGTHWSKYGEFLAADSLISYINSIQMGKYVPNLKLKSVETSLIMRDEDDDIERGMNLLFDIEDLAMGYPDFHIETIEDSNWAKVLTIGDSFYWGMFNWGCSRDVFNEGKFWYYNKGIYPDSYNQPKNVQDVDVKSEVEKNDVIVLMFTDANLDEFAFGFIDTLYEAYSK